jgi:hypothetical protein
MSKLDRRRMIRDLDVCEFCGGPIDIDKDGESAECPARGDNRRCEP